MIPDTPLVELAQIVLKSARPQLSPILGSQLSLTGFWFVQQFPHRAPPEYVRSGYVCFHMRHVIMLT